MQTAHQRDQAIVDPNHGGKAQLGFGNFPGAVSQSLKEPERNSTSGKHEQQDAREYEPQADADGKSFKPPGA
jgi:hypothetical protein